MLSCLLYQPCLTTVLHWTFSNENIKVIYLGSAEIIWCRCTLCHHKTSVKACLLTCTVGLLQNIRILDTSRSVVGSQERWSLTIGHWMVIVALFFYLFLGIMVCWFSWLITRWWFHWHVRSLLLLLIHPFITLFSRTTTVSPYQKGKPVWI